MSTAPITATPNTQSVTTLTYRIGDRVIATADQLYPGEDAYFVMLHGKAIMDGRYTRTEVDALIRELGPCTPVGLPKRDWTEEDLMRAACARGAQEATPA